jgi:5-methylcytosine-specific restriction enzyme A
MRPPRLCSCGKIVPAAERCACQITADRARKARHDRRRPTAARRGYNRAWREARADFLQRNPYCRHDGCGRPASIVHHVIAHKGDDRLFWDRSNWLPVCKRCHDGPLQAQERRA